MPMRFIITKTLIHYVGSEWMELFIWQNLEITINEYLNDEYLN